LADNNGANPRFAKSYMRVSEKAEARGIAEHRRALLADLAGVVCEVGAGHGLNFGHYPATVTRVIAIEPEPTLRARAEQATVGARIPIQVLDGVAGALPLNDGECDALVMSLVMCSVPDQQAALAEVRRVLRPGGELRFYEHVRSSHRPSRGRRLTALVSSGWWLPPQPRHGGGGRQRGVRYHRARRVRFQSTTRPAADCPRPGSSHEPVTTPSRAYRCR
jgi:ubiquinone/menaquinone biosynthesis C-methylase UbiE